MNICAGIGQATRMVICGQQGAQGELLMKDSKENIHAWHKCSGQTYRLICLLLQTKHRRVRHRRALIDGEEMRRRWGSGASARAGHRVPSTITARAATNWHF